MTGTDTFLKLLLLLIGVYLYDLMTELYFGHKNSHIFQKNYVKNKTNIKHSLFL